MSRSIALILTLFILFVTSKPGVAQELEVTPTATMTPTITSTPEPDRMSIRSPQIGQALQGIVVVSGNTAVEDFLSAELSFSYHDHPTDTWFIIQSWSEPVPDDDLAQWDTTTITDGLYDLRLSVTLSDGTQTTYNVPSLRVRNYTPIETNTPTPLTPTATPEPGDTPVPTSTSTPTETLIPPTATSLPPNPAELTPGDITTTLGIGALAAFVLFALSGIYLGIKNFLHRT